MRYIIFFFVLIIGSPAAEGQVIGDALRYAYTEPTGTARTLGLGGAISAVGTDFSTMSKNPAGLGWYRKSELVLTPSLKLSEVTANLEGGDVRERNRSNINFNNFGFVVKGRNRSGKLRSLNWAAGYNRIADFHQDVNFAGTTPGSVTDRFLELTSDGNADTPNLAPEELDGFEAGLAYEAGAIYINGNDPDAVANNIYISDFAPRELTEKTQIVQATGGINEFTIAVAGNIDERLLIGGTVGIPVVNYRENKTYREEDEDDSTLFFDELDFQERLVQTGVGINFKAGAIFRATQAVRVGLAVHTPTSYKLEDSFSTSLSYSFTDGSGSQTFSADSPEGSFEYKVTTPLALIGSGAVILGRSGLLTAEVEWQDYSTVAFNFTNTTNADDLEYEAELNRQIGENYRSALTVRLGGEFAYENLRVRAGYGLIGSPYVEGERFYNSLSAGIGMRLRSFYMDLGYRRSVFGETYVPYVTFDRNLNPQQEVTNNIRNNTFLLTFGFRF